MSNLNFPSCNTLLLPLLYCLTLPQRAWHSHLFKCLRSSCRLRLGPPYALCQTKQAQIPQSSLVLLAPDHLSSLSSFPPDPPRMECPELGTALLVQPLQCQGEEGSNFPRGKWGEREWGRTPRNVAQSRVCLICSVQIGYIKAVHFRFTISPWVVCSQSNRNLAMEQGLD